MLVPDWVPQNIAEVYRSQPTLEMQEIYQITGLRVQPWQAARVLKYLKEGSMWDEADS